MTDVKGVVNAHNEWDPLEEVIVGVVEGAMVPPWEPETIAVVHHENLLDFYRQQGGKPWPIELLDAAKKDIEELVHVLEGEGVKVRRPTIFDTSKSFSTPHFSIDSSCGALMPRDVLLVIGDQIIEAPMGWRSRYHENLAYKRLCNEYFQMGARWISAPRPQLSSETYKEGYVPPQEDEPMRTILTNNEPLFDAADVIKCGRDIFVAQSSACNKAGINWLQSHLGETYSVHEVEVFDTYPLHIDATFYPLAPGKLLINPERVKKLPEIFSGSGWDVLECPEPNMPDSHPMYTCSKWLNMNVLMLDEKRVVVAKGEENIIRAFKKWGLHPIEVNFYNFETIAGGLHCATVDIRRRGQLESYF
jgi:glycine amidinotransferase